MLEPKVIGAQNVRQALDYVARGEVDAGFVYATDALISPQVQVAFTVPTDKKILYPIAMVRTSAHEKEARQFLAFMNGTLAQAILSKYGFGKP
jgi:molybdate transport system substrate-binding protein